jgi:hypothetical protein
MTVVIYSYIALYELPEPNSYPPNYQPQSKWIKRLKTRWKPIRRRLYEMGSRVVKCIESIRTTRRRPHSTRHYSHKPERKPRFNIARAVAIATLVTMSANAPLRAAHQVGFDTDSKQIHVDNCATRSITNSEADCIGPMKPIMRKVKGIGGVKVTEMFEVTIEWTIADDHGKPHKIRLPKSFLIPSSPTRLLSPQHWSQSARDIRPLPRGTRCVTYEDCIVLEWEQRRHRRTIPLDARGSNVATFATAAGYEKFNAFCTDCSIDNEALDVKPLILNSSYVSDSEEGDNGDDLDDQYHEAHSSFDNEVADFKTGAPSTLRPGPINTDFSLDGPEQSNKADGTEATTSVIEDEGDLESQRNPSALFLRWHHRLGHASMTKIRMLAKVGLLPASLKECQIPLCTSCLYGKATRRPWRTKGSSTASTRSIHKVNGPGQCISVDQLVSTTPGYIAQLRGRPTLKRYHAATVFVDNFSRLSYVHVQKGTSAEETIQAKHAFERYARSHGVVTKHYHADNGIFADNKFREAVKEDRQTLSFCGVNAHFQNGIAERRIRELQDHARTMLIHATKRWPDAIDSHLWPYALRMANELHNHLPSLRGSVPPIEIFAQSKVAFNPAHYYAFGAPIYTLDRQMQAGQNIDKWSDRSRVGVYLGLSPQHARTVPLVLDIGTGLTSPQFHIRVDSTFQTMRASFGNRPPKSQWQSKCGFRLGIGLSSGESKTPATQPSERAACAETPPQTGTDTIFPDEANDTDRELIVQDGASEGGKQDSQIQNSHPPIVTQQDGSPLRRSARQRVVTEKYLQYLEQKNPSFVAYETIAYQSADIDPQDDLHPLEVFAASADPDTMYLHEAMKQPDKAQFLKAMQEEVQAHTENKLWELYPRRLVPQGTPIIPAVWSMKRKRRISTREVYKWKARLAFDGSKQIHGVNFWETYAPVASWPTIRYILTLALINRWHMQQIDFVLAYTQAEAECEMFMKIPKGFTVEHDNSEEYVLRIKKNYYGLKQAGRVWNQHLVSKLQECGFKQSEHDQCLFYRGRSVYVLYTDDSILAGPDLEELEQIKIDMANSGLKLTSEPGVSDFLGVKIDRKGDEIHLTQPHLINSILDDLRLNIPGVATKTTPASSTNRLRRHLDSAPFDQHFEYRSVIGKLNYLEKSTRPDIAFAVHQCARFSADPRAEHGKAIKWIGRYLLASRDKGIILRPKDESFEVYADADFSGNWDREEATDDPDTARSRTGFAIFYAGCPVTWQSKLQTEISLSTTESEFVSLSTALRTALPLIGLAKEMSSLGFDISVTVPTVHCKAFDDNMGAIEIALVPKMRPRTKHINVKYHHFRQHVDNGDITIQHVDSEDQIADFLTKMSESSLFHQHCEAVMGWSLANS